MSISQQTRSYLRTRPSLMSCLIEGVINYRALARDIEKQLGLEGEAIAIAAALRRMAKERKQQSRAAGAVRKLLKETSLRIRSNMVVATVQRSRTEIDFRELFHPELSTTHSLSPKREAHISIIQGEDASTLIFDRTELTRIRKMLGRSILRIREDVAQILLIFPPEIESTPGVISTVYQSLYFAGVNILEEMSCWTELMVAIDSADLTTALREIQQFTNPHY